VPWDREAVLRSVSKTNRCLIVHEDTVTAGFGAEVAATVAANGFYDLDAPIQRLAMADVPCAHNPPLMDAILPSVGRIVQSMRELACL
jgi:2-oxoisovalerate dehydrogenase E1 component